MGCELCAPAAGSAPPGETRAYWEQNVGYGKRMETMREIEKAKDKGKILRHQLVTGGGPRQCPGCSLDLRTFPVESWILHLSTHERFTPPGMCAFCNATGFQARRGFIEHLESHCQVPWATVASTKASCICVADASFASMRGHKRIGKPVTTQIGKLFKADSAVHLELESKGDARNIWAHASHETAFRFLLDSWMIKSDGPPTYPGPEVGATAADWSRCELDLSERARWQAGAILFRLARLELPMLTFRIRSLGPFHRLYFSREGREPREWWLVDGWVQPLDEGIASRLRLSLPLADQTTDWRIRGSIRISDR